MWGIKLKIISLFSGAGGLDWGFHTLPDYDIKLSIEKDTSASKTYAYNYKVNLVNNLDDISLPCIINCDIETINIDAIKNLLPKVDGIIGAPPCQDFSILRGANRKGIYVKRGRLYKYFLSFIQHFNAKFFIFENVEGLVSSNKSLAYKTIIEDFQNLNNYQIVFNEVVDFTGLGVPQRRKRLIIIGIHKELVRNFINFYEFFPYYSLLKKYPLTPIEVFCGKTLLELQEEYKEIFSKIKNIKIINRFGEKWKREFLKNLTGDIINDYILVNSISSFKESEFELAMNLHKSILYFLGFYNKSVNLVKNNNNKLKETFKTKTRLSFIPPGGNYKFVEDTPYQVKGLMSNVYRRLHPLKPSFTIIAYGGGGTWGYHYDTNRFKLTHRERARIQTFPDDFVFFGNNQQIRAQIGEAVPPLASFIFASYILYVIYNNTKIYHNLILSPNSLQAYG